ncbi:hypothetical protein C8Q75DRAFT_746416 [Abortiporus biennis]|nr:hypothetical protein C8Q75DRAFT_746416 [Abortiporus biennis]
MVGFGLLTRGPAYNPQQMGWTSRSREEWNEAHRPFRKLPPLYRVAGRRDWRPLPTFHWGVKVTLDEAYEACITRGVLRTTLPRHEYRSYAAIALVKYFQKKYSWVKTIRRARPLTNDKETHVVSLYTNWTYTRYVIDNKPTRQLQEVMDDIQDALGAKERWLWYWDCLESPMTGWLPTTLPEFTCYLADYEDNDDGDSDNEGNEDDEGDEDEEDEEDEDDAASTSSSAESKSDNDELTEMENEKRMK